MKTESAVRQAVRAVLSEHASKRRKAQKGASPQQASGQEAAQDEEQPLGEVSTPLWGPRMQNFFRKHALKSQGQSMLFCRKQRRILLRSSIRAGHQLSWAIEGNPPKCYLSARLVLRAESVERRALRARAPLLLLPISHVMTLSLQPSRILGLVNLLSSTAKRVKMASVLAQAEEQGRERPIVFASRLLRPMKVVGQPRS
ncbi:hypothetical protein Efla_007644 [Eimeria flavescens]